MNEQSKKAGLGRTPLADALRRYIDSGLASFHTPGHKGSESSPLFDVMGAALPFDLTELPETDSLFDAAGPIREAEDMAAKEAGALTTLFSAGGATLCLQAMLALAAENGGPDNRKIICARNSHRCAVNAMILLGLEPVWVWPRPFEGSPLAGAVVPQDVEATLSGNSGVCAVYLTSPDYYGVLCDIAAISKICRRYKVPLLIDNAHGGHLLYCAGALHPLKQGADLVCDSAHKTLPVLTGGALLHSNSAAYSRAAAKSAMALFGSTSPSFLTMLSLDLARAWLSLHGRQAFSAVCEKVSEIRQLAQKAGFFTPEEAVFDPARLTLDFSSVGVSGRDAAQMLRQAGLSPELCGPELAVLIPSPFNAESDFQKVTEFLKCFRRHVSHPPAFRREPPEKPQAAMTPRRAAFSACETVDVLSSAGRVAAESRCPCPPGIPVVMPGERITKTLAACLKNYGVSQIKVVK